MKIVMLTMAASFGTVTAQQHCDAGHCGLWECNAAPGAESWCSCYDQADDAAYATTSGCGIDGVPCDCGPSGGCTANIAGDGCGNNGGNVCDVSTYCKECDNAPFYTRRTNGNCGACGNRWHGPCSVAGVDTCDQGNVCSAHTCFVATPADLTPTQQEPVLTPQTTWVGTCQVCGVDGTPICKVSHSPHQCTPNFDFARRVNGNCGMCGGRFHGPCDSGPDPCDGRHAPGSTCQVHTCFIATAADLPPSKQEPARTAATTMVGLCEVCGSRGSPICKASQSPHECTPGQTPELARRSDGNCGLCGLRFHAACASPALPCSDTLMAVMTAQNSPNKVANNPTLAGLCEFTIYHN